MVERYDAQSVEPRWQQRWEESGIYEANPDPSRPKYYVLTMYPYPSGDLHVGHWYPMTPTDAHARFKRMCGFNVLYPMGFDAFGLPAENAAIKNNVHPREWTYKNIRRMEGQLRTMGASFDWRREFITCDPEYYRWNQWFFLQFYKRDLAYRAFAPVDWCPKCNTTLAREQVVGQERLCERCETPVIKKALNQWRFRITRYADELLDFSKLEWPEKIVTLQRNWIGRSEGAEFAFSVKGAPDIDAATGTHSFRVFTTRPDTIFGVTFSVLAPEHPLVAEITTDERRAEVEAYVQQAIRQTEIERQSTDKERSGVFTGAYAVHPLTGADVPIYVADYVLMTYGTGAIMAVPAHDERDFDFATRYGIEIRPVIAPAGSAADGKLSEVYTGDGVMVNSGGFDGLTVDEGKKAITAELERLAIGGTAVTFRIRDWLISRQRMWGTPIPILYCDQCGVVPVPEDQLPVTLPDVVEFKPTGESPLKLDESFRYTPCPTCGGRAERETDTMDTFIDSSWYQNRFVSPHNSERPFDPAEGAWLPTDMYTGGAEHAVMHLLYSRFFHKVMRDMGLFDELRAKFPQRNWDEPFPRLFNQGVITALTYRDELGRVVPYSQVSFEGEKPAARETGKPLTEAAEKMSKSKGNVVSPDDYMKQYGADVVRLFLMFIGPWELGGPWNPRGVDGVVRFLNRVWALVTDPAAPVAASDPTATRDLQRAQHQALRKVTQDHERFSYNTIVSSLMEYTNTLYRLRSATTGTPEWDGGLETLVLMLAPIAPHVSEEMWERMGRGYSVHQQEWPRWDEALTAEDSIEIPVQVNGKLRDRVTVAAQATEAEVREAVLSRDKVREALDGKQLRKLIFVPGKLVNLVIG